MQKAPQLKAGDKVAIVSLSSGILGEPGSAYQVELGVKRLKEFGLEPVLMPNTLKGIEYLKTHPQAKAADLKQAFSDQTIKGVIAAIGGNDTFRTLPYLLTDQEFIKSVQDQPKVFIGFSDTSINHLMFHQLGLNTFYGPSFLSDFAESNPEMLPYTKGCFQWMFENEKQHEIISSDKWYEERTDFSLNSLQIPRVEHSETHGYEVLYGSGIVQGKLLGGCLETLYSAVVGERYSDQKAICDQYHIFPSLDDWKDKIMFFETSESQSTPAFYEQMLMKLEELGVFEAIKALMVGKPNDEKYYEEYKVMLAKLGAKHHLPIIYNVNFGHCYPRTILPYGLKTAIDFDQKKITILEKFFAD